MNKKCCFLLNAEELKESFAYFSCSKISLKKGVLLPLVVFPTLNGNNNIINIVIIVSQRSSVR